jgi:hypothetical protein
MGLFSRRRRGGGVERPPSERDQRQITITHLANFVQTRVGVEAYIEPPTAQTQTTLLLIATTGEWTRRKVPDARAARDVAAQLSIPIYDVNFTGYPPRMRQWDQAHRGRVSPD